MLQFQSTILLTLLVSAAAGIAVPVPSQQKAASTYPKLIPGDGLPSLKSLGLTEADLFNPNFKPSRQTTAPSHPSKLFKRQVSCIYNDQYQTTRSNAIACRNYLTEISTYDCSIGAGEQWRVQCTIGNAEVVGSNYYNYSGGLSSTCGSVAIAAGWVIDNCSTCGDPNCWVEGSYPNPDNTNYVVYVDLARGFGARKASETAAS
ncbi:hypothetical protein EJ08DRAFT_656289 [Tothia fuscella]|uniref:Uncharacterized protein n=1 Tax=Tothia fuscella TaxID=1048955 RepID=A0A9P4P2A9_9PEZI|nr:hypothetical protein EJ08DRAFT_656289 [Tothia fuscella]